MRFDSGVKGEKSGIDRADRSPGSKAEKGSKQASTIEVLPVESTQKEFLRDYSCNLNPKEQSYIELAATPPS